MGRRFAAIGCVSLPQIECIHQNQVGGFQKIEAILSRLVTEDKMALSLDAEHLE